ncbi:hypothetical protein HRR82_008345 [Exophiala dermatitidis]|nr:hypothetical protein HRR82_008345 [Exophiala dermatitidis]KAJ4616541.1 hypothetical protein HRR85_003384 [Exophiala dermatitidis]
MRGLSSVDHTSRLVLSSSVLLKSCSLNWSMDSGQRDRCMSEAKMGFLWVCVRVDIKPPVTALHCFLHGCFPQVLFLKDCMIQVLLLAWVVMERFAVCGSSCGLD